MRKLRAIQTALAALLLIGCADVTGIDNPRVEVRTDRASYAFGEEGVLTVTNLHRNDIGVMRTLCGSRIERRVGEEWEHVGLIQSPRRWIRRTSDRMPAGHARGSSG